MSIACIIIAGGFREKLLTEHVIPSVLKQTFDECVIVGTHCHYANPDCRYLHVPSMTGTTNDALIKRDCGTLATVAETLVYLSDDHALLDGFGDALRSIEHDAWDVMIPARYADHPTEGRIRIPMGDEQGYCAGHAGVFRRSVIRNRPWSAQPHDRCWDVLASRNQQEAGYDRWWVAGTLPLGVIDMEPEAEPWR